MQCLNNSVVLDMYWMNGDSFGLGYSGPRRAGAVQGLFTTGSTLSRHLSQQLVQAGTSEQCVTWVKDT